MMIPSRKRLVVSLRWPLLGRVKQHFPARVVHHVAAGASMHRRVRPSSAVCRTSPNWQSAHPSKDLTGKRSDGKPKCTAKDQRGSEVSARLSDVVDERMQNQMNWVVKHSERDPNQHGRIHVIPRVVEFNPSPGADQQRVQRDKEAGEPMTAQKSFDAHCISSTKGISGQRIPVQRLYCNSKRFKDL